jgi:hypothetical protein
MVRGMAAILYVASETHLVRIVLELQGCEVVGKVRYVGRVTTSALCGSLAVTGRPGKRLDNECRLSKSTILIEGAPRKCVVRPNPSFWHETVTLGSIVHFVLWANFSDRSLAMTLGADTNAITIVNGAKVDGRFGGRLLGDVTRPHLFNV